MSILDITSQQLGDECKLDGFCVGLGSWEVYIYKKYLVVLDICCQQLRDECKSEGFCVRFGHTVWKCTFIKMHICIGYMLPTI